MGLAAARALEFVAEFGITHMLFWKVIPDVDSSPEKWLC